MKLLLGLLLLLALTTSSSAIYCLCKDGIGESELQTSIDYACGTLADCNPIHENGPCYQPNTIKSHCDWAVNSYFQKAAQISGSCNFSGTATTNQNPPTNLATGCIYPSSPSSAGSPPSTTPPTGTTPTNGTTPSPGTPTNGTTPFPGTPTNGTTPFPGTPFPGAPFPGSPPAFGPTGVFNPGGASSLVISSVFTLCFSSLAFLWRF
uniref:Plasmodesmata callose-binding protein 3 n=1 Tax=Noccaea caerulescens TaxID=107243 RepID=A0A1J3I6X5_NOCCA